MRRADPAKGSARKCDRSKVAGCLGCELGLKELNVIRCLTGAAGANLMPKHENMCMRCVPVTGLSIDIRTRSRCRIGSSTILSATYRRSDRFAKRLSCSRAVRNFCPRECCDGECVLPGREYPGGCFWTYGFFMQLLCRAFTDWLCVVS